MILFHPHYIHAIYCTVYSTDKFFATSAVLEWVCVKYYVLPNSRAVNPGCQQSCFFEEKVLLNNRMDLGLSRGSHRWVFRYSFKIPQKLKIYVHRELGEWRQCCRILVTRSSRVSFSPTMGSQLCNTSKSSREWLRYEGRDSSFLCNIQLLIFFFP